MQAESTLSPTTTKTVENKTDEASLLRSFLRLSARGVEWTVFAALIVAALGSIFHVDYFTLGMGFTYSPRIFWLAVALPLGFMALLRQDLKRLCVLFALVAVLCYDTTWGGGIRPRGTTDTLTLLSFNTHYASGSDVAKLCDEYNVDILTLQENRPGVGNRGEFVAALPDYVFFAADQDAKFTYSDRQAFTCLTGIRKELVENHQSAETFTGITDFRTFATQVNLTTGPLRIVNVHTTKPLRVTRRPKLIVSHSIDCMQRHREEHALLTQWLEDHSDEIPTVIAGDFNAPGNAHTLRYAKYKNAQRVAGQGMHLTFPAKLPLIGIDHVLGNDHIDFQSCKILDTGISDHRAMLVEFSMLSIASGR